MTLPRDASVLELHKVDPWGAYDRIRPHLRRTPVMTVELAGYPLIIKLDNLQKSGAFKIRGALNTILQRVKPGETVITASGGNHGAGVAHAAGVVGANAIVYVPCTVPEAKAIAIAEAGAEVIRIGNSYDEAASAAHEAATEQNVCYVHAFDDPDVIAGQGTLGVELNQQAPEADAIVVAVGGGGLVAGIISACPTLPVIGVEPHGVASVTAALKAGYPVPITPNSVTASALGTAQAGALPFEIIQNHRDVGLFTMTNVSDEQVLAARDLLWQELRLAVEPAAAAAVAAVITGQVPYELPAVIICGGNAQWEPA